MGGVGGGCRAWRARNVPFDCGMCAAYASVRHGVRAVLPNTCPPTPNPAQAVLDEHKRAPRTAADTNKGRQMHHHAQHLLQVGVLHKGPRVSDVCRHAGLQ